MTWRGTCETCRFAVVRQGYEGRVYSSGPYVECRRYPQPVKVMGVEHWCGEHQPLPPPPENTDG